MNGGTTTCSGSGGRRFRFLLYSCYLAIIIGFLAYQSGHPVQVQHVVNNNNVHVGGVDNGGAAGAAGTIDSSSSLTRKSLSSSSVLDTTTTTTMMSRRNSPPEERQVLVQQQQQGGLSLHAKQVLLSAARRDGDDDRTTTEGGDRNSKRAARRASRNKNQNKSSGGRLEKSTTASSGSTSTTTSSSTTPHRHELPPLESLISFHKNDKSKNDNSNHEEPTIIANVQFLLDFAVVGFGKCGTTTLLHWLQQKNTNNNTTTTANSSNSLVRAPNYEAQFLVNQRPAQLVRKFYQFAVEEQEAYESNVMEFPRDKIYKGFKNPSDIRRPQSRRLLKQYWPQTPLIVTVRNPVEWMVSLYNYYKIEKGRQQANVTAADVLARGGRDARGNTKHYVSTAKGEFHAILAQAGKTTLATSEEWDLLRPWLLLQLPDNNDDAQQQQQQAANAIHRSRLPNPIFFMDMKQMADTNMTRAKQFADDLETFIGLPHNHLPPVPLHIRPNTQRVAKQQQKQQQQSLDHLKMDICAPDMAPVLNEMVSIARSASLWFRRYFIESPDVTVSSPEYLNELLEGWMINPCQSSSQ